MKKNITLTILLLSILLHSCKDETIEKSIDINSVNSNITNLAIGYISDEDRVLLQSDKTALLINQIKYTDSIYFLELTQKDAQILNIPDSIYIKVTNIINELNMLYKEQ